jgi:hypothetical protein
MSLHCPWSCCKHDEFNHPGLGWTLVFRAITLDNWLLWRDALPPDLVSRKGLTPEVAKSIERLASELHATHQAVPGYSRLSDSPWRVVRWWSPREGHDWATGRQAQLSLQGVPAAQFADLVHFGSPMAIQLVADDEFIARLEN